MKNVLLAIFAVLLFQYSLETYWIFKLLLAGISGIIIGHVAYKADQYERLK